jgi:hypothetical protein
MHPETLRRRVRQAEADGGLRPDLPMSQEQQPRPTPEARGRPGSFETGFCAIRFWHRRRASPFVRLGERRKPHQKLIADRLDEPTMDRVNASQPNGHVGWRLVSATSQSDGIQRPSNRPGGEFAGEEASRPDPWLMPPPPHPAVGVAPLPVAPAAGSQSNDGSSMNLGLYARVIWRFKWVMALGLIVGVGGAYMLYKGGGGSYSSRAQLFITQTGFTWGSNGEPRATSPDDSSPAGAGGTSTSTGTSSSGSGSVLSPYVPGVDPQRLSSLASLYAQLAGGSAVRTMLPVAYRDMLNPASGAPTATLSANAVTAAEYANPAILPLVTFWATGPSPSVASGLASAATDAFQRLVMSQQASVAPQSRVVAQVVQPATRARPAGHKSKSLPILIFMASVLGAFGLSLALENTRPRSASRERKRSLMRKRGHPVPAATPVAGSPAGLPAEELSFAESGAGSPV